MVDLNEIVGFDWDAGNLRKSQDKHDVSMVEAEQIFFNQPLFLVEDARHSIDESRFHAFGHTDGDRLLHITFALRESGSLIRVISARDMSRPERKWYATQIS